MNQVVSALVRGARTCTGRPTDRPATQPTGEQLTRHAMRHLAAAALVLLAAVIVHRAGHTEQQWQYAAIAAALVPQVLVDLLAARDPDRRARLRAAHRPASLPLLAAGALALAAPAMMLLGHVPSPAEALAAGCAAVGLTVAAAPLTIVLAPRSGRGGSVTHASNQARRALETVR